MPVSSPVPLTEVYESFNKANSPTLGPNHTWTKDANGSTLSVVSNELSSSAGDSISSFARCNPQLSSGNYWVEALVLEAGDPSGGVGGANVGVTARFPTTASPPWTNFYGMEIKGDSGTPSKVVWRYYKDVNNVRTNFVLNAALPSGVPGVARLEVNGSTIRAYWKGELLGTTTDTAIAASTSQQASGVVMFQGVSGGRLDDFRANPVAATARWGVTITRSIAPAGVESDRTLKNFASSVTAAGVLNRIKVVTRIFTASVASAGLFQKTARKVATGSSASTGGLAKYAIKRLGATVAMSSLVRRAMVRYFTGAVTPASTSVVIFLGRAIGRIGRVIMEVRKAGELRMRMRRR